MTVWLAACVLLIVAAAWPGWAQDGDAQPSFDCAGASAPLDALICADASLADLDRTLADSYHAALATRVGEAQLLFARGATRVGAAPFGDMRN